jgi:hypothetical protein
MTTTVDYLSNVDTFGAIKSVLISEVILYIICGFGTNKSVLISVHIERFPTVIVNYFISFVLS